MTLFLLVQDGHRSIGSPLHVRSSRIKHQAPLSDMDRRDSGAAAARYGCIHRLAKHVSVDRQSRQATTPLCGELSGSENRGVVLLFH